MITDKESKHIRVPPSPLGVSCLGSLITLSDCAFGFLPFSLVPFGLLPALERILGASPGFQPSSSFCRSQKRNVLSVFPIASTGLIPG